MGTLRCQASRTGEIFSFAYDNAWLKQPAAFTFDPDLALVMGRSIPFRIERTLASSLISLQTDGGEFSCRNARIYERDSRGAEPDP